MQHWGPDHAKVVNWDSDTVVVADIRFIAHAREDVPKLLDENEQLREALRRVVVAGEMHNGRGDVLGWSPEAMIAKQALA